MSLLFFFFNATATTEIYTLSLHDALPISFSFSTASRLGTSTLPPMWPHFLTEATWAARCRSEEHTSELQSRRDLVCRLLLEKKKNKYKSLRYYRYTVPLLRSSPNIHHSHF